MIPIEWMPPLMFAGLVAFMLIGYPVAFTLSALGLLFGLVSVEMGFFEPAFLQAIPGRIFGGILANELLLAIPFFTFMGAILEKCGLAEDMLDAMGQLFGPVRGGLGYSVILVGFILGAITGTVAAQVIAMALISLPVMIKYNYNMKYATGVLAASGTITQLVPPSLVLVVLADQLGKSVGDMYLGAWGPSILQMLMFVGYTFALSRVKPDWLPAVPREDRTLQGRALVVKCLWGIVPSAVLIFLVLGTLLLGLATPTESGAMGAVGAMLLATLRHRDFAPSRTRAVLLLLAAAGAAAIIGMLAFKSTAFRAAAGALYLVIAWLGVRLTLIPELRELIRKALEATMRLTAMVVFILVGSTCFSIVFQGVNGGPWLEHWLTSLPGGVWGFLLFVNLFVFFLAFFLDFFEIVFIIVPLLAPVAKAILAPVVGEDAALVWFGVMLCVNLQTSFMHPPFGFALFYLRGVAPKEVRSADIYWGAIPWVLLQLVLVALVIAFPKQVTMFLDAPQSIDVDKVRIEMPAAEGGPPESNADEELQRALGGKPPAPGDGTAPPAPAPSPPQSEEEKAAAEIQRMLERK
jgi:tripartite ATP-independent transporter DctM subunit